MSEPRRDVDAADLAFVRERRIGHLATADEDGTPSVVPVCYALVERDGAAIVTPLDAKPKSVDWRALRRVRNIAARPDVSFVVDDYDEDWSRLAWVMVRGRARLVEPEAPLHGEAVAALREKYPQYRTMPLEELPIIAIEPRATRGWRFSAPTDMPSRVGGPELAALVRGRRSVRAFRPDPVPRAIIERAIEAAGWAPSPHGRQPWRFAVVEAPARRAALAEAMAATWREQLALDGQAAAVVQHRLDRSRERLETAPVLIVPCLYLADLDRYPDAARQAAEEIMAIQSFGAAVQNLLLSLYASGVDGGWMCAPLFCPDVVRDALGLAPDLTPHALIAVGYAARDPVRRPRLPLDRLIVSWE
ncbi:MAG TPA: TIGR03668 family PPOX class F420-dependent oxidoreductase [Thermomicrobiales bacterium]|nr:TIGR03668 family PPOX class F420-dependent oxidoreductase [Thermomicrobiales bacterium]